MTDLLREDEAGRLYIEGFKAVRAGGHELSMLSGHLHHMLRGTSQFPGALWQARRVPPEGLMVELEHFRDYLLRPAREGLGLPSLHFLRQTLNAMPDGPEVLALVRKQFTLEGMDFDAQAKRDELKLHGEREPQPVLGTNQHTGCDNITRTGRGTSAAYLAGVLKRDHPEIAKQLAEGKYRSVRAAAIEAGIVKPSSALDRLRKDWKAATDDERNAFLAEVVKEER